MIFKYELAIYYVNLQTKTANVYNIPFSCGFGALFAGFRETDNSINVKRIDMKHSDGRGFFKQTAVRSAVNPPSARATRCSPSEKEQRDAGDAFIHPLFSRIKQADNEKMGSGFRDAPMRWASATTLCRSHAATPAFARRESVGAALLLRCRSCSTEKKGATCLGNVPLARDFEKIASTGGIAFGLTIQYNEEAHGRVSLNKNKNGYID